MTTQNDRKRSRNLMEMVSEVNFKMLRPFRDHFELIEAIANLCLFLFSNFQERQIALYSFVGRLVG